MAPRKRRKPDTPEDPKNITEDNLTERDLYEVLGVDKQSTQGEIKKAYHRLALQLHPDKNIGDQTAHSRFQTLQRVFAVLRDPDRRRSYDQTGSLEDCEQVTGQDFDSLYEFYRSVYAKVSVEDIDAAYRKYRGSDEEMRDLCGLFSAHGGRMSVVFEHQICSEESVDCHRFKDIIDAAVVEGRVESTAAYQKWAAKVLKKKQHKDPLSWPPKDTRNKGEDLALTIRSRASGAEAKFDDMIRTMEAKYAKKPAKSKKRK